jgi:hypothetical protein
MSSSACSNRRRTRVWMLRGFCAMRCVGCCRSGICIQLNMFSRPVLTFLRMPCGLHHRIGMVRPSHCGADLQSLVLCTKTKHTLPIGSAVRAASTQLAPVLHREALRSSCVLPQRPNGKRSIWTRRIPD